MRRIAFWTLLVLDLLLAAIYVASIKRALYIQTRSAMNISIEGGLFIVEKIGVSAAPFITIQEHFWGHRRANFQFRWSPLLVRLPLYAPLTACSVLTLLFARRRRRPGQTECQTCGYDLRGQPVGKDVRCPECGTIHTAKTGTRHESTNAP